MPRKHILVSVVRAATREDFEPKIGRLEYSIGRYDKIVRATIPIRLFGMAEDESKYYYLLISFDLKKSAIIINVIEDKVMPFIEKNKDNFV
jgi:hypothetical protein